MASPYHTTNPISYNNTDAEKTSACIAMGWEVENKRVFAYGLEFPLVYPYTICLKTYRVHTSLETRFEAMEQAFFALWPRHRITYNYWGERMFREHCDFDTEIFSLAGGAGIGKTFFAAYIAAIFWLSLPHKRTVIVTSTTLDSLQARIFGYTARAIQELAIPFHCNIGVSPSPSIRLSRTDKIHGIYGIAAKIGTDEDTIKNIKGRHPDDSLLLILDEATDMPMAILGAIPNLRRVQGRFQAIAIGNSNSLEDLHGAVSTPAVGWENIDPFKDYRWKTQQPKGYCLYFNPYDSPAIHEPDPIKKKALSKILLTEEKLAYAERTEGKESIHFWMFTMGFWRFQSLHKYIVTEEFLKDYDPTQKAEFSGRYPLLFVAGLDPAFSAGGDKCILRLGILGQHVTGKIILDFKQESLIFILTIRTNTGKSAEIQIAEQCLDILEKYNIPLSTLCVDASGAGRGLADILQLKAGRGYTPTKIFSTNISYHVKHELNHLRNKNSMDHNVISSSHEMWFKGREFIANRQLFGLDVLAFKQLHTREIIKKGQQLILEPKAQYKSRMSKKSALLGRSPDEADAAMLTVQSAIIHHGFFPGQEREIDLYGNKDTREYEMARKAYNDKNSTGQSPVNKFNLVANYKKGIESIISKRMF